MELRAYQLLSTRSKRAICRNKKTFGRSYQYSPKGTLLTRLSRELGISTEKAYELLMQEREFLLKQMKT